MPLSLKARWRFISKAVREEFKRSRWYKLVSIIATLWFILGVFNLFGLTIPAPSLSWRTATFFLIFLVIALALIVEAVYRFHRRTVSAMYDEKQKAVWIVMKLTEVAGMAAQIDRLYGDKEDEAPKEIFQNWLGALRTALQDLNPSAVSDFTNGHPEELDTVPDSRRAWFLFLRERLSKWIGHQTTLVKQAKADHEQLHS
jgi:hypothetical protein